MEGAVDTVPGPISIRAAERKEKELKHTFEMNWLKVCVPLKYNSAVSGAT